MLIVFMHHIELLFLFFCANLQFVLSFSCFLFGSFLFVLFLSIMPRKTRTNRTSTSSPSPTFNSERFLSKKNQEAFEKLNLKRNIWAERKILLDELDPEIRCNFKHRGWLPLLDISHPPLATLIREFYSNLSVHSYDANTLVRSWVRDVGYTITPLVVADALGVLVVQHPVYPYDESPPLDDIMSYITGSFIQWGSDPRITTAEFTKIHYLFFRIACHSFWPISHLNTIPLERCAFLYALITNAPISFPHLFIRSLIEVHRSSSTAHALFFPVFIHRMLCSSLFFRAHSTYVGDCHDRSGGSWLDFGGHA